MSAANQQLFRIIDANLNRSREGLRVCEDITRFIISDENITKSLKFIRHGATKALLSSKKASLKKLVQNRDTKNDNTKFIDLKKTKGTKIEDIFMSNIERAKESFRVLEECSKLIDEGMSRKYRNLRFKVYDVEKELVKKVRNISCNR